MPLVEQYPNWVDLPPVPENRLAEVFRTHSSAWQQRPEQSFFAECNWYKFPYCCHVPWYQELNTPRILGLERAELYQEARVLFDHMNKQLGDDFVFWGAELNDMPAGVTVQQHSDKHFYSDYTTRLHAVLETNPDVEFMFETQTKHFTKGECFIFNNKLKHSIANRGSTSRLHLVADFVPLEVFKFVERSIGPFGGHETTPHILKSLKLVMPEYNQFIRILDGNIKYPCKTAEHVR